MTNSTVEPDCIDGQSCASMYYYHSDHLGSSTYLTDERGTPRQYVLYLPFGETMLDQKAGGYDSRYKYTDKETDENTGLNYHGARYYNSSISMWYGVDPLIEDYPAWSPFNYVMGNPIRLIDPTGMSSDDIVTFNMRGEEISRIKSDTEFRTIIQHDDCSLVEITMPKVIEKIGEEKVSDPKYQRHDYQIAASTYIFNYQKNEGAISIFSDGNISIPKEAIKSIPDLDPTLVKAIAMQESRAGTNRSMNGLNDIMQVNNKGDWSKYKSNYGLKKGIVPSVKLSIEAGIKDSATKGFRGGITYNSKTGAQTFTFKGWESAVNSYNGGGTEGYQKSVLEMFNNSKP